MNLLSKYKAMLTTPKVSGSPVMDISPITEERENNSKNAYRETGDKIDQTLGKTFIQPKDNRPQGEITFLVPHPNPESHHLFPRGAPAGAGRQKRQRKNVTAEPPPEIQPGFDFGPSTNTLQSGTICKNYGPK